MGVEDPAVRIGIIPFACVDTNFHRRRGEPGNWLARLEMSNDIRDRMERNIKEGKNVRSNLVFDISVRVTVMWNK